MMQLQNYSGVTAEKPGGPYHSGGLLTQQLELMQEKTTAEIGADPNRPKFTTIDDLLELARKLVEGPNKLMERKDPLSIRRGVRNMERENKGEVLKAASKTYFFDIRETREGKPYLVITESRLKGKDQKPERSSIMIFQENIQEFATIVTEIAERIVQGS